MKFRFDRFRTIALMLPVVLSVGCSNPKSGSGTGSTGTGSTATYPDSTGNWVVVATATSGALPFSQLSGYINEQQTGTSHPTTAAFQPVSTGCYAATENVPMQGVVQGLRLHVVSFGLDQQVLDLSAAKDTTSTHFTGSYAVTGGCADGAAGTVTGTRYDALTGTYSGTVSGSSPSQTVAVAITQYASGTGDANFLLSGTVTVTGVSCFTKGSLSPQNGSVVGANVQMHFVASQGATMDIVGTFDTAASVITVSSLYVGGTGCPATVNLGPVTLSKA